MDYFTSSRKEENFCKKKKREGLRIVPEDGPLPTVSKLLANSWRVTETASENYSIGILISPCVNCFSLRHE